MKTFLGKKAQTFSVGKDLKNDEFVQRLAEVDKYKINKYGSE